MRNKIISILLVILVIGIIIVNGLDSKSEFVTKKVSYNGNNLMVSIDGVSSSALPNSGTYYLASYDCSDANTKLNWDKENYKLNVSNGNNKGNVSCYLDFQSSPLLSSMEVGSYVKYIGNNGCVGKSCEGQNANYVNENKMGYCQNSDYQFVVNGWRIGYINSDSAYLVSAGATDCLCTNKDGESFSSSCDSGISYNLSSHITNINNIALKYCNTEFVNNGICNKNTVWAMNENDYSKMVIAKKNISSCYGLSGDKNCGYNNDLIDNGGFYWNANVNDVSTSTLVFGWQANSRLMSSVTTNNVYGVRPVISLSPSVVVLSGNGTYDDPYIIGNNSFVIEDNKGYVLDKSKVVLNFIGTSNTDSMCVSVDSSGCSNYVNFESTYSFDWSNVSDGKKIIYVYYKDKAGNVIASMNKRVIFDSTAPSKNSVKIGDDNSITRTLSLSSDGASYMCISNSNIKSSECSEWVDYATSYTWNLSDGNGEKTVYVFFKDKAGNVSEVVTDTVIYNKNCLEVNESYNIGYSGKMVTSNGLDVKICKGTYNLQLWGAQGGNLGGKGGYSAGDINLTGEEILYFYVGGAGGKGVPGFNGGGTAGSTGGGGGGATDIRIGEDSLYARFIVAGGGGGTGRDLCANGGFGGGTIGGGSLEQSSCGIQAGGGTQISGGSVGIYEFKGTNEIRSFTEYGANAGKFGIGGNSIDASFDGGAGGGGWYGGGAGASGATSNGGGGGSSFVYTSSSTLPNGYLVKSNYQLKNTVTMDGSQDTIPTIGGNGVETGHIGNGYIKITRLS